MIAVYVYLAMFVLGVTALHLGFSFFFRESQQNILRLNIFMLSLSACMACCGYSASALSVHSDVAYVLRDIGLLGIDLYAAFELILIVGDLDLSMLKTQIFHLISFVFVFFDMANYGRPGAVHFIRNTFYTSFECIDIPRRTLHYLTYLSFAAFMFITALYWFSTKKYKRDRRFVFIAICSNFIMLFSSVTDALPTIFPVTYPSVSYTTGLFLAFIVFYFAADRYSAFAVTNSSIGTELLETLNFGIMIFNADAELNMANPYSMELLGLKRVNSQSPQDLFHMSEKRLPAIRERLLRGSTLNFRLLSKNTDTMCMINASAILDGSKEPMGYIISVADLTEENRLIAEAQAANEAKSVFLSNMSHEIRTPINTILGMNELILREATEPATISYAKDIETAGNTLLTLVNDILDFSKIEANQIELVENDFSVQDLLQDCYRQSLIRAQSKGIGLNFRIDEKIPQRLHGDDLRIHQVLMNLLTNAIKYNKDGGQVTLELFENFPKEDSTFSSFTFRIKDTGIGIRQEALESIFETFQRADITNNRNIEGTGLGLSITRDLIHIMQGQIQVESTYGEGSVFTVQLPIQVVDSTPIGIISFRDDLQADTSGKEETHTYHSPFIAPNARILAVDDMDINLKVLCGLLKTTQIQVDTALSGQEALDKVAQAEYDFILMDHMMPVMDGVETLIKIREAGYQMPVVMLTANAVNGAMESYLAYGFDSYISKPIQPEALEQLCRRLLEQAGKLLPFDTNTMVNEDEDSCHRMMEALSALDFLDTEVGLNSSADDVDFYLELLHDYTKNNKLLILDELFQKKDWTNYRVQVHGLKGISRTIGALSLGETAYLLEQAAAAEDADRIHSHHPDLMQEYQKILKQLEEVLV